MTFKLDFTSIQIIIKFLQGARSSVLEIVYGSD